MTLHIAKQLKSLSLGVYLSLLVLILTFITSVPWAVLCTLLLLGVYSYAEQYIDYKTEYETATATGATHKRSLFKNV